MLGNGFELSPSSNANFPRPRLSVRSVPTSTPATLTSYVELDGASRSSTLNSTLDVVRSKLALASIDESPLRFAFSSKADPTLGLVDVLLLDEVPLDDELSSLLRDGLSSTPELELLLDEELFDDELLDDELSSLLRDGLSSTVELELLPEIGLLDDEPGVNDVPPIPTISATVPE